MNDFRAWFQDGYTFRHLIATMQKETQEVTMLVDPTGIIISFVNHGETGMYHITIRGDDLREYEYEATDKNGDLLPHLLLGFSTKTMNEATKTINRKDGIILRLPKSHNQLLLNVKNSSGSDEKGAAKMIDLTPSPDETEYIPAEFGDIPATVKISSKEFSGICNNIISMKCECMEITGYPKGALFQGIKPGGRTVTIFPLGVCPMAVGQEDSDLEDYIKNLEVVRTEPVNPQEDDYRVVVTSDSSQRFIVPISTVRALSKINNLAPPNNILKLYFGDLLPMKLESPVGGYGKLVLVLRGKKK
jgi:hypothetical protein